MSPAKTIQLLALSGVLALTGACDKGPKTGEPTPAAKTVDTASDEATPTPAAAAEAKVADTSEGQTYGAGVEAIDTVSISDISADPEAFDGKTVKVEGMITDVCAKRGCWFEMAGNAPGEKARFKVTDGEMVFPMTSKGKKAVAQGKVVAQKLSLEDTRAMEEHYATESGRKFDPATITEGRTVFRIQGTGAVISD
jgi:hypothetical protein